MLPRSVRLWASGVDDWRKQLAYHRATPLEDRLKHHCDKLHNGKVEPSCLACKDMAKRIDERDHVC